MATTGASKTERIKDCSTQTPRITLPKDRAFSYPSDTKFSIGNQLTGARWKSQAPYTVRVKDWTRNLGRVFGVNYSFPSGILIVAHQESRTQNALIGIFTRGYGKSVGQ
jgi:hypothetical protein